MEEKESIGELRHLNARNQLSRAHLAGTGMLIAAVSLCATIVDVGAQFDAKLSPGIERPIIGISSVVSGKHTWDEWHAYWSSDISGRVEYFDHFFGDDRLLDDNDDTRVVLRLGVKESSEDHLELQQNVGLRLALPNLQKKLQMVVDNVYDIDEPTEDGNTGRAIRKSSPDTGLRYIFFTDERIRLNADVGVRLTNPVQVFGRLRGSYTVPFKRWQLRLTQRIEDYSSDGFKESSAMVWTRELGDGDLISSRSALGWQENRRGIEPQQSFTYYDVLSSASSWKTTLRADWPETPSGGLAVYGLEATYRRLLHSDWLFGEITPGFEFIEEKDYVFNPFLLVMFEIVFEKDPPPYYSADE